MQTESFENIESPLIMDSAPGALISIAGKECNYFGGTSYYELHKNEEVLNSAVSALKKYGITSSSSRSSYGTTKLILEVEREAADFFNCQDAVYLSSGFLTDMAAIQACVKIQLFDCIFIDEVSHYSNDYAVKLSGKPVCSFLHLDSHDLEEKLKQNLSSGQKPLIISDGIFPIFGKIAPADKYLELAEKYNGIIWLDDAHGMGILGENGRGTYEHHGLISQRIFSGGTLSKAFGGFGGIIPGTKEFINEIKKDGLLNGSTPPPSSAAAASLTGLKLVRSHPEMRLKLWRNAERLKKGLKNIGIEVDNSHVPIAAWTMKSKSEMKNLQRELQKKNILIQYMQYAGTGEEGALRIVVFSSHSSDQIDNLIFEIKKII